MYRNLKVECGEGEGIAGWGKQQQRCYDGFVAKPGKSEARVFDV